MSEEEERHDVDNGLGEGPSTFRSTPSKPVLDETWTQVEELPDPNDSDYTDEEVEYIALDLGADFPKDVLTQVDSIQLTRLNSSEPWIRVGPHIMHGRHERMLGSDLLLELPPTDPDTGKPEDIIPIATTQARIRFEPVALHAKSYGNPKVRLQNASSYLAPKIPKTNVESSGRGRGRGSRGRGRTSTSHDAGARDTREGSALSSTLADEGINSSARSVGIDATLEDQHVRGSGDTPGIEEF